MQRAIERKKHKLYAPAAHLSNSNAPAAANIPALFIAAAQAREAGRLEEAKRICLQILAIDVGNANTLNLLGLIAHQCGGYDAAVKMFRRAVAIDGNEAAYYSNLGLALNALGRFDEAAAECRKALSLKPGFPQAEVNLAHALDARGDVEGARKCLEQALASDPGYAPAHRNLGTLFMRQGKAREALACFEHVVSIEPDSAEGYGDLGAALMSLGELEQAKQSFEHAVAIDSNYASACNNLGGVLALLGEKERAKAFYERALAIDPRLASAHSNLSALLLEEGDLDRARTCAERALVLNPDYAEAHSNLGAVLNELGEPQQAKTALERALECNPNYVQAWKNLGTLHREQGRQSEAAECFLHALRLNPRYPEARNALGMQQLLCGEFSAGWENYEARWLVAGGKGWSRPCTQPPWNGERLAEDYVYLWGEQGIGDEIMFAGLIPNAVKTGNSIVLDCEPRLQPLFARSFPGIEVICAEPSGWTKAQNMRVGAHLPTGSLPRLFRPTAESFKGTVSPYLKADVEMRERLHVRYADGRKLIGLAWQTRAKLNGRKRCIDLAALTPLFEMPGVRWINLQYGDFNALEQQVNASHSPLWIDRTVDQLADMDSFAAQIAALDLVISIDNATVHLAGALGIPAWVMLPFVPDWRWQLEREDSPWYPSLRLFRQSEDRAWELVIERLCAELSSWIGREPLGTE